MKKIQLLLLLLLFLCIFRNYIFVKKEPKNFIGKAFVIESIKDSELEKFTNKEIIQSEKDEEGKDDIDNSHDVIEESKRSLIRIVDVSLNGCPFDHYDKESPCKTDICIKTPKSKECKEYINIFCNRKDLDKKNKIGCDIYYKVLSDKSIRPRHEPYSIPDSPPHIIAQLIPQFIERDMIDGYKNKD
mgnify:CR=1 FL=1